MAHYAKLWSSILDSTIWAEDDHTRLVWITMLAMSDSGGYVGASVPGLATRARVPLQSCEKALITLKSPDLYSRTKEHDGCRIKEADGGWQILNYEKHREATAEQIRREQARERQRKWRNKRNAVSHKVTRDVTQNNAPSRQAEAEAEAEVLSLSTKTEEAAGAAHAPVHPATAEGEDPARKLLADVGLAINAGPVLVGLARQLIAYGGYEAAKGAIEQSLGSGKGGKRALDYAKGILRSGSERKNENGNTPPATRPWEKRTRAVLAARHKNEQA